MGLTLEQLMQVKTKEQHRDELLLAMRGVGYVEKVGSGEGSLALSGSALASYDVVVGIRGAGAVGEASFRYSLDGGLSSNGLDILVPASGEYVLPGTGVTLHFINGPGLPSSSFYEGDEFHFTLSVPTLPTTSWHSGSTPRTIVEVDAEANEDFTRKRIALARGGYLLTAEGPWLDLHAEQVYRLPRQTGQLAQHSVLLRDTGGGGPYTVTPGQLVVGTASGLRFSNIEAGTLPQGGEVTMTFEAERKGTEYNAPVGSINLLLTSLAGVLVTNPDIGNGSSLVQQGVNREEDEAYRARAMLRWPSLGTGSPAESYELWARTASANVNRAYVAPHPTVPGSTLVYLAGPAGPVDQATVDVVDAYIQPRIPLGSLASVASAVPQTIALTVNANVRRGFTSQATADINRNLTALFQGGRNTAKEVLPGISIGVGSTYLYHSELVEQVQLARGVRNITITPSTDHLLVAGGVAVLSLALNITEV